jgi:hypothetical protein
MKGASRQDAIGNRLAAQWAVFFARTGQRYEYRPKTFTLPSRRRYTPDFHVEDLGWITICEERSIFEPPQADTAQARAQAHLLASFERFFEFASECEQWCYWLGGPIPFHTPREVRQIVGYCLDDLADPARMHRAERLHEEWPQSYCWFKLRRHDGPRRLPRTANRCGALLARLRAEHGEHFKDWILDSEAFDAFNNKAALLAARSAHP